MKAAADLLVLAKEHAWLAEWQAGEDSGGHPFFTVHVAHPKGPYFQLTWHTRKTGTYRIFGETLVKRVSGAPWVVAPPHQRSLKGIRTRIQEGA